MYKSVNKNEKVRVRLLHSALVLKYCTVKKKRKCWVLKVVFSQ